MILCPRCLKKIEKEIHTIPVDFVCPSCRQTIENSTAIPTIKFPDCISRIRYVGVNSLEEAKHLLKMME